jgi:dipeptidyl aminopeptidase/acylaminoacyl peptidase
MNRRGIRRPQHEDGYSRLQLFDVASGWEARRELPAPALPPGIILEARWSQDGAQLALTHSAANDTADVWVWDVAERVLWRATRSSLGGIPRASFIEPSLVRYPTFDGREIPAFLYLPRDRQPRGLPVVINVHGGPEGQVRPSFDPMIQYLVAQGYAVLAPNVRGSTGYGYEYQSLDDVRLRMNSVADLQYAVFWLRESGIADPKRIAVMGGSYGGFMVLSAITTYPDLWAAAVDIVGVANFVTFLENTGPWRRKMRESEYGSLEHDREFLEQISPIHYVDRITAPLLVVHGANDPRVPIGEAEQIVAALRSRSVPVEYMRFEDEGHGLVKRANKLVAYPAIARFLDKYLGRPEH